MSAKHTRTWLTLASCFVMALAVGCNGRSSRDFRSLDFGLGFLPVFGGDYYEEVYYEEDWFGGWFDDGWGYWEDDWGYWDDGGYWEDDWGYWDDGGYWEDDWGYWEDDWGYWDDGGYWEDDWGDWEDDWEDYWDDWYDW